MKMKTRKRHFFVILIILIVVVAGKANLLQAQERANWDPTQAAHHAGSYVLSGNYTLTSTFSLSGDLTLTASTARTISRGSFNGQLFNTNGHKLTIKGTSGNYVTIDGGARFPNDNALDAENDTDSRITYSGTGDVIAIGNLGGLELEYVIVQNGFKGNLIYSANQTTTDTDFKLTHVKLRNVMFYGDRGTAIITAGSDWHTNAKMTDVEVYHCKGSGATIRTNGAGCTKLTLDGCHIHDNWNYNGGGIQWNANGSTHTELIITGNTIIENNTVTGSGGGIIIETRMQFLSGIVRNNKAAQGGGLNIFTANVSAPNFTGHPCSITISKDVQIIGNEATTQGGGICLLIYGTKDVGYDPSGTPIDVEFKVDITGGEVSGNKAPIGAGIYIDDKAPKKVKFPKKDVIHSGTDETLVESGEYKRKIHISSGSVHDNITDRGSNRIGAGIYIKKYRDPSISYTNDFGNDSVVFEGGEIYNNIAYKGDGSASNNGCGGALAIENIFDAGYTSTCNVLVKGTTKIYNNECGVNGAGIYLNGGNFTMKNGTIGEENKPNKTLGGNGGGVYVSGGSFTMTGGTFSYNKAQKSANIGGNGGGFYVTNGAVEITGGSISYNEADDLGGGFYVNPGTNATTINSSDATTTIHHNQAANGGGLYSTSGTVNITDGTINYNYASLKGGGIYIPDGGSLNLYGSSTIAYNRVPYGGLGGGAYVEGKVQVGHVSKSGDVIKVATNYADVDGATITNLNRNNIYLPNPSVNADHKDVITVVDGGLDLDNSSIGFSVPKNFVPVIYCASADYLPTIKNSQAVFEDSHSYEKYYTNGSDDYDPNYIYLAADSWVRAVTSTPSSGFTVSGKNVTISNAVGLAWLVSYVNNLNGATGSNQDVNVTLTADVDMSAHKWVPIGYTGKEFTGTFNGGGHVIKGLRCSYIKGTDTGCTGNELGLFGVASGATIHDVTLSEADIMVRDQNDGTYSMGAIANEAKNSTLIYNCIASSTMESTIPATTMGGLVGKLTSGTVHSSAAMADMTGYYMGGFVGTNSGTIYNSFANPKFEYTGPEVITDYYVGGLVAENTGRIENCYVRLERTQLLGSAHFGMLAGSNTGSNTIAYCYAPNGDAAQFNHIYDYLYGGSTTGLSNCDHYNKVIAPYKYNNSNDNTLVTTSSSNLLDELNRWVTGHSSYSPWKRTRAGGYITGQDINGDYPIHKYSNYHSVASTDGINLDYATTLDAMLSRHNTDGTTINLYAFDAVDGSGNNAHTTTATGVVVYVDEDVCVLPEADKNVRANACQTLKTYENSRWHDVSSSLQNSKIGFTYGSDYVLFSWDPNPCSVTLDSDNNESLFPTDLGDLARCDLYCFYEPEYHWLNLKRNTNSHWHMNATTEPIDYIGNGTGGNGNEDHLVPGKGYLVSVDKDQLLENEGILNRGNVTLYNVTKSDNNAWAGRLGFNLLGNPYQSYLDFEEFKSQNATSLWEGTNEYNNTYAVFDPSQNAYVQYKSGASVDANTASQYIHPHQGFFIRMTKGTNSSTTVTYTNAMRTVGDYGAFRNEEIPAYPLVNFLVRDSEGNGDVAVLELGRDNNEGTHKMRLGDCTGKISLGYENEEYGILFRTEVEDYQSLHFEATEEGTFTLTWNTANAEFDKLTLIDNITGTTTDMLGRDSYCFEATPDQYASRFKVVIGDYKGIDEPEVDGPSTGSGTFAFQMGDQLVVNGEGELQIIDMLGRVVMTDQLTGSQSTTSLPSTAGVYVLRLTDTNGTRTQKMVIR